MYEERRETFSIKDIILQILLIVLFVLILIWIFPTKGYMKKFFNNNFQKNENVVVNSSQDDLDKLAVLYNQIFANNVATMKEAAIGYYTNERLPQNIGGTEKMTLGEMYNKHLLLKLTDKNGDACNTERSYVSITKYKNEYQMKVNLSCGSEEDYIIVYLGCYDYCEATGVCEKQEPTKPNKPTTPSKPKPTDPIKPTDPDKKYVCEYKKVTGGYWGPYGEWSKWSKDKVTANDNILVETKTEKEVSGYTTEKVQTGTKTETYIKGYKDEQYISGYKTEKYISKYIVQKYITGYKTEKVQTGTKTEQYVSGYKYEKYVSGYVTQKVQTGTQKVQVGTTTKTVTKKVPAGTTKQYVSSGSGTTVPNNGNGYIYIKTGSKTSQSCSSCATITVYTWDVYKVVTVYKTETVTETVPVYESRPIYEEKKVPVYSTKKVPVYSTRTVPVYTIKKVPVYGTKKVPVYSTKKTPIYSTRKVPVYGTKEVPVYTEIKVPTYTNVTYYRYKERKYIGGSEDIKWSTCDPVNTKLTNQGYKLTGAKREA